MSCPRTDLWRQRDGPHKGLGEKLRSQHLSRWLERRGSIARPPKLSIIVL